jgi:DNA-binding winged helix-turn-helix (wHTH) protein
VKNISGTEHKSALSELPFKFSNREFIIESDRKYETLGIINIEINSYNIRLLKYISEYYCQVVSKDEKSRWFSISINPESIKTSDVYSAIKLFQDVDSKKIFILYETVSEVGQSIGVTTISPGITHIETLYGLQENLQTGNGKAISHLDVDKLIIKYSGDSMNHLAFSYPDVLSSSSILKLNVVDSSEISSDNPIWDKVDIFSKIYDNKKSIPITTLRLKHNENETLQEVEIDWKNKTIRTKDKISDSKIVFSKGKLVITDDMYISLMNNTESINYNMEYTFTWDDKFLQPMLSNISVTKLQQFKSKFLDSINYSIPCSEKYIFPLSHFSDEFSNFVLTNLTRRFDLNSLVGLCERNNYYSLFNLEYPSVEEQDELFRTNKPTKENADKYLFLGSHLLTNSSETLNDQHRILLKDNFLCLSLAKKVYEHLVDLDTANGQYILGLADVKWELYNSTFPKGTDPYVDNYPFKDDSWISDYKKYLNLKSNDGVADKAIHERIQQRLKNK